MKSSSGTPLLPHLSLYDVWPPAAVQLSPDWESYSDEKLLMLYQTGNPLQRNDAFSAIYNRYRLDVARYLASMVESEQEARDILCDVWTKAAEGLGEFTWQGTPLRNWLIKTAKNTVWTQRRKKKETVSFEEVAEYLEASLRIDSPTPLECLIDQERQREADQLFHRAISTLKNPLSQQILVERYFNGTTKSTEIASNLGIQSSNTIRGTLSRARKSLLKFFPNIKSQK